MASPVRRIPTQAEFRIFVGVGGHDLAEVDAVKISLRVGFVADGLRECVGDHIVAVHGAALIVHNTFLDDGRAHLAAGHGGQVHFLKLVVIAPGNRSAMARGRGKFPRRHVDREVAYLFQSAVGVP